MKFVQRPTDSARARRRRTAAFTLAEVLAALLFMAVVIPVALEGMHVASRSGSIAVRKSQAERIAERILNESIVTTNWSNGGSQSGDVTEGVGRFHWVLNNAAWNVDPNISTMRLLSVDVSFTVQGQNNSVRLSTIVDSAPSTNTASQ